MITNELQRLCEQEQQKLAQVEKDKQTRAEAEAEAKKARAYAEEDAMMRTIKAQRIICDKILQGQRVTNAEFKQLLLTKDSIEQIQAMYPCLNVTVNAEALDILSKICSGDHCYPKYHKQEAMVILLRYVGSDVQIPIELVDKLLTVPDPVVSDKNVQVKYAQCLLHYTRKIWSDVGRVVRAQGVTVSELQAATARISTATKILQCWARMYSRHVALTSFENCLVETHGVLSPLDDEDMITEEREYAVAYVVANVYEDHNEWFKKTTEKLRAARAMERIAVSESAVENNDKAIQENFLHVEADDEFLTEKIVLSVRTDVCDVAMNNKSVVVRANGVFRPAQGDASRKLLQVPLIGDVTIRNDEGMQPRVLVELTHSKRESSEGHVYQTLVHTGRKIVTLLHKKEDGQVLQLELRRHGTVYKLKDADMDFQRRQERRQKSSAARPKLITPQSSTEFSSDTTSSEDEEEGSPILGKAASVRTVTATALPTTPNSAAVVSKSLADKSSCGRRNFVRRQARKSKAKARNTTAVASNVTSAVVTATTSCSNQGEPTAAVTPCVMDTNKSTNTTTDAMSPQASAASNTSCHVVTSATDPRTNEGESSLNSTDKGPANSTHTEKQPAQGTKKRAKRQLFTARECAGTRQSNVSRKPS